MEEKFKTTISEELFEDPFRCLSEISILSRMISVEKIKKFKIIECGVDDDVPYEDILEWNHEIMEEITTYVKTLYRRQKRQGKTEPLMPDKNNRKTNIENDKVIMLDLPRTFPNPAKMVTNAALNNYIVTERKSSIITNTGNKCKIAAVGEYSSITNNGEDSIIIVKGDHVNIHNDGNFSMIYIIGNNCTIMNSALGTYIFNIGDYSTIINDGLDSSIIIPEGVNNRIISLNQTNFSVPKGTEIILPNMTEMENKIFLTEDEHKYRID